MRTPRLLVAALAVQLALPGLVAAEPERFNRAMLGFNQWWLEHVFEPTAQGWNFVMPKWGQRRVVSFWENVVTPRDAVNSLLQGKLGRAGGHVGRFMINSTFGLAGFFDLARDHFGLTADPETVDETLGVWGLPPGPYLVLPILGEFCPRSLVGWVGDGFLNPLSYIPGAPLLVPSIAGYTVRTVNLLAQTMPSPCDPEGAWDAYRQGRFRYDPYEVGRELFFRDEAERVAD